MPDPPIPTFPAVPPEGAAPWQTADYQRALAQAQARVRELKAALRALLANPYGCPFCDSGKLRTEGVPEKDHNDDCGYVLARAALAEERIAGQTESTTCPDCGHVSHTGRPHVCPAAIEESFNDY